MMHYSNPQNHDKKIKKKVKTRMSYFELNE